MAKHAAQPLLAVDAAMKSEGGDGRSQGRRVTTDLSKLEKPSYPG
jgi:hypothetical protein